MRAHIWLAGTCSCDVPALQSNGSAQPFPLTHDTTVQYQNNHKGFSPKLSVGWYLPWSCTSCVFQMPCRSLGSSSKTWAKGVQGGGCLGWQPGPVCQVAVATASNQPSFAGESKFVPDFPEDGAQESPV